MSNNGESHQTIQDRLSECRKRSKLSFRDLAGMMDFSFSFLSNVHNGRYEPTLELLEALAPIYHTTVTWMRDGKFAINIWGDLQASSSFSALGQPETTTTDRAKAILCYLHEHYPGHATYTDIGKHMGIGHAPIAAVVAGKRPTEDFIRMLSEISGVPIGWIEIGNMYALRELGPVGHLSSDTLRKLLLVGARAEALGVPKTKLNVMLDEFMRTLETTKGGA